MSSKKKKISAHNLIAAHIYPVRTTMTAVPLDRKIQHDCYILSCFIRFPFECRFKSRATNGIKTDRFHPKISPETLQHIITNGNSFIVMSLCVFSTRNIVFKDLRGKNSSSKILKRIFIRFS